MPFQTFLKAFPSHQQLLKENCIAQSAPEESNFITQSAPEESNSIAQSAPEESNSITQSALKESTFNMRESTSTTTPPIAVDSDVQSQIKYKDHPYSKAIPYITTEPNVRIKDFTNFNQHYSVVDTHKLLNSSAKNIAFTINPIQNVSDSPDIIAHEELLEDSDKAPSIFILQENAPMPADFVKSQNVSFEEVPEICTVASHKFHEIFGTTSLKEQLQVRKLVEATTQYRKKVKALQQKLRRKNTKIGKLKSIIANLKKERFRYDDDVDYESGDSEKLCEYLSQPEDDVSDDEDSFLDPTIVLELVTDYDVKHVV